MTNRVQIVEMTVGNIRAVLEQIQPGLRYQVIVYWDGKIGFRGDPVDYQTATTAMTRMLSSSLQKLTVAEVDMTRRGEKVAHAA